ncbi:MAG TPA: zinc-binding dehydrogenase, partial [Lapillicoccus sp.]
AEQAALVRSLGADDVADSRDALPDGRFDAIIDTGRHRPLRELRAVLNPRGTLVLVGNETSGRWLGGLDRSLGAHLRSAVSRQRLGTFVARENTADLDALRVLVESGRLRPAVAAVYPLADTAAAVRQLLDGGVRGKIGITV